ncbi:hypothetical protein HNR23_000092 [Nocardiopsis mwathae]|uniref:ABC transporter permease n=1 Tax=Nocardiopsis mwathae TaxID=1472723 RepID=A0A7W9YDC6_9ACTN|nr:hypothetical protein [Nocardiopsis mwathae]MBB6170032.1 hypothetical protein [Nocardiopsis mwathae]
MRPGSILSEAWRDLATGTTRAAVFAVALAAVTASLAITDARAIIALQQRAAEFVDAGAAVRILNAVDATDGAACEALSDVPSIGSAGAVSEGTPLTLAAMPDNPVPVYEATPGMGEVLGVRPLSADGVWIPTGVAERLGVGAGRTLETDQGPMVIAGVYDHPDDGRDSRLGYAVVVPTVAAGEFDQCWAHVWPVVDDADELIRSTVASDVDPDVSVTIGQLNTRLGASFDAAAAFSERITRAAVPGAALAGLVLGFLAIRARRLEIAGALHVGQSRRALLAAVLLETAAWSVAALALAAFALLPAVGPNNPADPLQAFAIDIRGPAAAVPAALAGAVVALLLIREDHLFRYFKDR